jgi:hypothetical protein
MMNDECVRNTRKRESGRGLFFEVAAGNADEVLGETGKIVKLIGLSGGFGGEEDFVVADGEMVEQVSLVAQGF